MSPYLPGRPLGSAEFVQALEGSMKRWLTPLRGGRHPKASLDPRQSELAFGSEEIAIDDFMYVAVVVRVWVRPVCHPVAVALSARTP
jgi:hypothetical protein